MSGNAVIRYQTKELTLAAAGRRGTDTCHLWYSNKEHDPGLEFGAHWVCEIIRCESKLNSSTFK